MNRDDRYAVMLLTMALSPNREEYARPLSTQELAALEDRVRDSRYRTVGALLNVDISGLMIYLDITEEEAYRLYTLLHRGVQLGYTMDALASRGIEIVTECDEAYPERLRRRLGRMAPPFFYRAGELTEARKTFAVVGISGVKTTPELRDGIENIVRDACEAGYTVMTGGEMGVSRVAAAAVEACGGAMIDVLGGAMTEHLGFEVPKKLLEQGRAEVLSMEHPDALFTVSHAITRNKVLFSLADAALICSTDNKRGESDVLRGRLCDHVYAWTGCPANGPLLQKGAVPVTDLKDFRFREKSGMWNSANAVQLDMFSLLDPEA